MSFKFKPDISRIAQAKEVNSARKNLPVKENIAQISGWISLIPEKTFAIEDYEVSVEHLPGVKVSYLLSGHLDYAEEKGLPILKKANHKTISVNENTNRKNVFISEVEVSTWNYSDPGDSYFTLADYGLGTAGTLAKPLIPRVAWLVLSGVIFIAIGVFLQRKSSLAKK